MAIVCDTKALLKASRCLPCLTPAQRRLAQASTFCKVAAVGIPGMGAGLPLLTNFLWVPRSGSGVSSQAIGSWDVPPASATGTELWTSADNITYVLAGTVASPGTNLAFTVAVGTVRWAKARWVSATSQGPFCAAQEVSGNVCDWARRCIANGAISTSLLTRQAMNTFDLALIAAGIDSQMISMLTYVPDGLIAAITPLYKVAGNDPWTNNGPFLAADLTVNGLKGDGDGAGNGTKYLHTGCIPSAVYTSDNDGGLTIYTAENLADNVTASIGSTIVNFTSNSILKVAQAGTTYFECWDLLNPPGGVVSSASGGLAGFWSGNRIANNNLALYFANSGNAFAQVAFANSIQGNRPTCAMIAHAINDTNNPGQGVAAVNFDRTRISFAAIHHGMTSANTQALFNAVQAYLVQKGGGFV